MVELLMETLLRHDCFFAGHLNDQKSADVHRMAPWPILRVPVLTDVGKTEASGREQTRTHPF
jgi:hypothetical protein